MSSGRKFDARRSPAAWIDDAATARSSQKRCEVEVLEGLCLGQ